jgi:hypothetical protein
MDTCPDEYFAAFAAYPGIKAALQYCDFPFYIASSKDAVRVSAVATRVLGLRGFEDAASPRLFASLLPPDTAKANALRCAVQTVGSWCLTTCLPRGSARHVVLHRDGVTTHALPCIPCTQYSQRCVDF